MMEKFYLKGLEITDNGSKVIVTGQDYQGKDYGGVFPKSRLMDGKLEVLFLGDERIDRGCFPRVTPVKGYFENRRQVLVNLKDVERRVM